MARPGSDGALVRLEGISKHFGEGEIRVDALREVSLEVFPRQVVALLGPSGSGKTTLLNIIGCILDPSAGSMELDSELVLHDGEWQRGDLRRTFGCGLKPKSGCANFRIILLELVH